MSFIEVKWVLMLALILSFQIPLPMVQSFINLNHHVIMAMSISMVVFTFTMCLLTGALKQSRVGGERGPMNICQETG
jgi:Tfp pilus assembly major pilin PilA